MYMRFGKRLFDIVVSFTLIVFLSPLFFLLAVLVRTTSKGPAFFSQKRVTKNGHHFRCLKFRSMKDRKRQPELSPASSKDHTVVGTFLRKYYLDELPQLFNVLTGDLSLIGPRAWPVENCQELTAAIPQISMRHQVKAGIVSLARVTIARRSKSTEDYRREIDKDLEYISKCSFLLDSFIILRLPLVLTFVRGE